MTTLIGLVVAAYARGFHKQFLARLDAVSARVVRWLAYDVLPRCDEENRAVLDLNAVFEQTVRDFQACVDDVASALREEFRKGAETVVRALAEFTESELTRTLRSRVSEPFHDQMRDLAHVIEEASRSVAEGCDALRELTVQFVVDLSDTIQTPDRLTRDLKSASDALAAVTRELGRVLEEASGVTGNLRDAARQLELTLDNLWKTESRLASAERSSFDDAHQLVEDLRASSSLLDAALENMTSGLREMIEISEPTRKPVAE